MAAKKIDWRGTSLDDLRKFPEEARAIAGQELRKVQHGQEPLDWKSINDWGSGVIEIRLEEGGGAFRVVYVAKFEEAIYVLHSFQKKSQKTSKNDIDVITSRYKDVVNERRKK
ncbi:type II toxin-antitoxin system RelE/ParE family toxin [Serratia marcescens]|uniref:Type II toxin-antitoxin system RelE/ParE family toxin n=1 Tax=Serratia marcescens TaxID=615 RepID=A0ABD6HMX4_SERMA|nr:type II toxin-antitoxin system RelE/ParE family toxin [Serratia marcescens]MVF02889.1 hypothetical protein [Serratia marcescens]